MKVAEWKRPELCDVDWCSVAVRTQTTWSRVHGANTRLTDRLLSTACRQFTVRCLCDPSFSLAAKI